MKSFPPPARRCPFRLTISQLPLMPSSGRVAKERGLRAVAKLQVNTTWEIAAVPYLPVLDLVAEHMAGLVKNQVDGAMLSWTLGGYPSPNLAITKEFFDDPSLDKETALDRVASHYYGHAAPHVRAAWTKMSDGFREIPYSGSYVYRGPQHLGPANLLYAEPTGYPSTMVCYPYFYLPRDLLEKVVACQYQLKRIGE